MRCDLQDDAKPIDFFNLYYTDAVIQKISDETNRYTQQFLETEGPNLKPYSIVHGWKDTNLEEVRTFLGVCVLMHLIHKLIIWMYWSTDTLYNTPFFGQLMTRTRFLLLNKFLHFQDIQHPGYDPNDPHRDRLFKIRDIMNMLKEKLNTVYYPSEHITVDKSLVLFKGRLLFKQYIKSKRSRFGIKFYELSTAGGIFLDFILYQGNIEPSLTQPAGKGWMQTERIPLTLIDSYLDRDIPLQLTTSTLLQDWLNTF